jgi:hypothetical protein
MVKELKLRATPGHRTQEAKADVSGLLRFQKHPLPDTNTRPRIRLAAATS